MLYHEQSDDYRPLLWVRGHAVYANTLLIIGHVTAFALSAICISYFGFSPVFSRLALDPSSIWHHGEIWRLFSYVAFDPSVFCSRSSYWFLVNFILLYFFGREVEQFVGRRAYLLSYAALIVVPAVLFCLLLGSQEYLNFSNVIFGVFVAFATIYPGSMPSFWIPLSARMLMWILLGVTTLVDLASRDYPSIFMHWSSSAVAYVAMRMIGAGAGGNWLMNWLEERRMQRQMRQHQFKVVQDRKATESIDAILDKISKQGVDSLDSRERAALEKARANLLKRDQR